MKATVYSTTTCVWCDRTISLLKDHDVEVNKVEVDKDPENLSEMQIHCGGSHVNTVPQVIIDGKHIGGFTETERYIYSIFPRIDEEDLVAPI